MDVNREVKLLWKLKKNIFFFFLGGGGGGVGWGVRVDVNGEVKFLCKFKKNFFFFFFLGGGGSGVVRSGGGVGEGGSKVWGRWVMWRMGDVYHE